MDEIMLSTCEACGGSLEALGKLGNRLHLRCRGCGLDQSEELDEVEDESLKLYHSIVWVWAGE